MQTAWPATPSWCRTGAAGMRSRVRLDTTTLVVVWAVAVAYVLPFVHRGWVAHDDGAFAQSALRVLAGELPHRDFDELYTGGLTWVHAAAMWAFGPSLASLRLVFLAGFVAWVPAYHLLAARFVSPPLAALTTLTAVAWTVPNDFSSRPSWYNLFCATFGVLALLRHVDTGRRRWLVLAGVAGGLSCAAKIVGVYFLVAGVLFLVYREQVLSSGRRSRAMIVLKAAAAGLLGAALVWTIAPVLGATGVVELALPPAAMAGFVAWSEARDGGGDLGPRLRALAALVGPFLAGAALPIALLLVPFVRAGAVGDLVRGVFVTPQQRIAFATFPLPPLVAVAVAVPYGLLLARARAPWTADRVVPLAALLALLLAATRVGPAFSAVWLSAQPLAIVAALGAWLVLTTVRLSATARQELVLVALAMGFVGLVQVPYAAPMYFAYAAPLVLLALVGVVARLPHAPGLPHVCVLAFYGAYAVLALNPGYLYDFGLGFGRYEATGTVSGLHVRPDHAVVYADLLDLVRRHRRGPAIFAGPDAPEVYVLAGARNPTRTLFDFLAPEPTGEALVATLAAHDVTVAVVNEEPFFSHPLSDDVRTALARAYPASARVGQFVVRWKP